MHPLYMKWAEITHVGLVRPNNEDSLLIEPELGLFAVADGMGGHQAGEVASFQALFFLQRHLHQMAHLEPGKALSMAIGRSNRALFKAAALKQDWQGMGTTLTACLIRGCEFWIGHIGDSRAYLLRDGFICQLTEDHSLVGELVKSGTITCEEARLHPRRNVLVRALGASGQVDVDLIHEPLYKGDRILLCTDGLTHYLSMAEIAAVLNRSPGMKPAVKRLVDLALERGGQDNITAILVEAD